MRSFPARPARTTRAGFTLVELLVVMAIIGVLAGLVLSGIVAAREAAASTQCQNNLRQLGMAINQFHTQNKAYPQYRAEYPPITNAYGVVRPRWQWILAPYLGGWAQHPDAIAAAGTADPTYTNVPLDNKVFICTAMDSSISATYSIRNGSYRYNF